MRVAEVGGQLEDGFLLVGYEAVADCRGCAAVEGVACVGHGEVFEAGGVGEDPGHEVDDLPAVEVDDAEGGALLYFEGVAVATRDDVGFGGRAILEICWTRDCGRRGML